MAYTWDGMKKVEWEEVILKHENGGGLAGYFYLHDDGTEAVIEEGYSWSDIVKHHENGDEFGMELVTKNTRISYLYRDASNYKQHNEVVVSGTFTPEQIEAIIGCLDAGEYFIPVQVGFPEERFEKITEDDHCWFELSRDGFEETDAEANIDMAPSEVVAKFLEAKGNWDDSKEFGGELE